VTPAAAWRWGAVLAYMAGLFLSSSTSNYPSVSVRYADTVVHLLLYAGLASVSLHALAEGRWSGVTTKRAVWAVAIAVAYGGFDEVHQSFVAGRSSEWADLLADAGGATAATVAARGWVILTKRMKQEE